MNYYKFTDGTRTGFRATARLYRSGMFDAHGNVSFSGDVANRPFSWPTVEIGKDEYKALVELKDGGTASRDSWVWNNIIDAFIERIEIVQEQLRDIIAEAPQDALEAIDAAPAVAAHPNREAWLMALVEALRPTFVRHGSPLPAKIRVSCSFPSRGGIKAAGKATTIGQCWYPQNSADGTTEVFVSPAMADPSTVAEILVHELCHAALGPGHGHGKVFKRLALAVGLEGKMTATYAGSRLLTDLAPILRALGPYPHASLDATAAEKKQTTRLIKVTCPYCEYSVRITRKWLDEAGGPICPVHLDPMEE